MFESLSWVLSCWGQFHFRLQCYSQITGARKNRPSYGFVVILLFLQVAVLLIQQYILICSVHFLDMLYVLLLSCWLNTLPQVLCNHNFPSRCDKLTSVLNALLQLKLFFCLFALPVCGTLHDKTCFLSLWLPRRFRSAQL